MIDKLFKRKKVETGNMVFIGVAGTSGKTIVTELITHTLRSNGYKVSLINSIGSSHLGEIDREENSQKLSKYSLNKFIKKASDSNSHFVVLEMSSKNINKRIFKDIELDSGVITNVYPTPNYDSWTEYAATKLGFIKLIGSGGVLVIGNDDPYFAEWLNKKQVEIGNNIFVFMAHPSSLIDKSHTLDGLSFSFINGPRFESGLRGLYNYMNIYLVIQLCSRYLPIDLIVSSLKSFKTLPGRFDIAMDDRSKIFIDEGVAPFQLEGSLKFLNDLREQNKRIITVFGLPLDIMDYSRYSGRMATKLSDMIILAPNDPNTMHTYDINSEIYAGAEEVGGRLIERLHSSQEYRGTSKERLKNNIGLTYSQGLKPIVSFDAHDYTGRLDAIHFAKLVAEPGDIILIAGKGDSKSLIFNNIEYEWSDYEAVRTELI